MLIKHSNTNEQRSETTPKRKIVIGLCLTVFLFGFTSFVFVSGGLAYKNGIMATVKAFLTQPILTTYHYFNGAMQSPEVIDLHIKHDNFQYIAFARLNALEKERHATSLWEYVPAILATSEDEYKVKVKLKGTGLDHWEHPDKWSFKVSVKKDNTVHGMKQFSLMHPRTRSFIYDWVYQQYLKDQNFIYRRKDFVKLRVNGRDLGIYAMEEDFEKRLIENNKRHEGPVVAFSKETLVSEWVRSRSFDTGNASFTSSPVIETIGHEGPATKRAISLLEAFRGGEKSASEVFDLKRIAHFVAARALFKSLEFDNNDVRFYYNSLTSKLEPIGGEIHFDDYADTEKLDGWWLFEEKGRSRAFHRLFFRDPEFLEEYYKQLDRITRPGHFDKFLVKIDKPLSSQLSKLHQEFPWVIFRKQTIERNCKYIQQVLKPLKPVHAYLQAWKQDQRRLKIGNTQFWPTEILGIQTQEGFWPVTSKTPILASKTDSQRCEYKMFSFQCPDGNAKAGENLTSSLEVVYRLVGASEKGSTSVYNWMRYDSNLFEADYSSSSKSLAFQFLEVDESKKTIRFKDGDWIIESDVIIPEGYLVTGGANCRYDIRNGASLFIYSPVSFLGTQENPMVFSSSDSSAQGIAVINAEGTCRLQHVRFENLNNPSNKGWSLTSAITFYQCKVEMQETSFAGCRSEDSLNLVRSKFLLSDCSFSNSFSDALDIDFSDGSLERIEFRNCGNDALDTSGSLVSFKDLLIDQVGDKAISGGEASNISGSDIIIRNSALGVVSKDQSVVSLDKLLIEKCEIAFSAYQKKSEFSGAEIVATNVETTDVAIPFLIEEGSKMMLNQRQIQANDSDTKSKLYGVEFGKSSK